MIVAMLKRKCLKTTPGRVSEAFAR